MPDTTVNTRRWRVANAVLWYLTLLMGYFSREVYDGLREIAHMSPLTAWVNNPWFLPLALSYVVGRFVRDKGVSTGLNAVTAAYEGIGFGLVALVAFSALPVSLLMALLPSNARILYLGYLLKLGSFVYLVVLFTRYLVIADENAFFGSYVSHRQSQQDPDRDINV